MNFYCCFLSVHRQRWNVWNGKENDCKSYGTSKCVGELLSSCSNHCRRWDDWFHFILACKSASNTQKRNAQVNKRIRRLFFSFRLLILSDKSTTLATSIATPFINFFFLLHRDDSNSLKCCSLIQSLDVMMVSIHSIKVSPFARDTSLWMENPARFNIEKEKPFFQWKKMPHISHMSRTLFVLSDWWCLACAIDRTLDQLRNSTASIWKWKE